MAAKQQPRIAVLLPCYNEEAAIGATVAGFREALPDATIYVYDNNSRDRTRRDRGRRGRDRPHRDASRARAMSCGACSPTSTPTSISWPTAI